MKSTKGDELSSLTPLEDVVLEMEVEVLADSIEGEILIGLLIILLYFNQQICQKLNFS